MRIQSYAIFIALIILFVSLASANEEQDMNDAKESNYEYNTVDLYMFYGQGCPHCSRLRLFLEDIQLEYPSLNVHEYEIYNNPESRNLFKKMAASQGQGIDGVPTVFIDNASFVGVSNSIIENIKSEIERCTLANCTDPMSKLKHVQTGLDKLTIPIVISAAAVDAINPCAFAVLIILMTAALSITNKKRALKFGLAFTVSIYISYFLMGLGLFSALQASGLSHGFYIAVTVLAVIIGLLNIKDYFWYGKGFLMEVPLSWRPKMKKLLKSATTPWGAFLAGFVVSLFELPCTGGPYITILGLLAKEVTRSTGVLYLLLYNVVFVSPLIILSIIIYKGISSTDKLEQIRQERIRVLHLIAGILMLAIAGVMILSIIKGWV